MDNRTNDLIQQFNEDDDSITLVYRDIVVNDITYNKVMNKLIQNIKEYISDYYNDIQYWGKDANRRNSIGQIVKDLSYIQMMHCGKNIRKELNLTNEEIKEMLMKNFKLDKQGRPIISKDDEWYYEDEWDKTPILESIERSFREIKQFKEGKTQFKTLKESQTLWDKWAEEVDDELK